MHQHKFRRCLSVFYLVARIDSVSKSNSCRLLSIRCVRDIDPAVAAPGPTQSPGKKITVIVGLRNRRASLDARERPCRTQARSVSPGNRAGHERFQIINVTTGVNLRVYDLGPTKEREGASCSTEIPGSPLPMPSKSASMPARYAPNCQF